MTPMDPTTAPSDRFGVTRLNRVRRHPERAHFDRATVHDILDRGLVAHVGFVEEGRPVVIPMMYGYDGDRIYLHGARKGRISTATDGQPVSVAVTLVDGLVVARSLFDSSMNYRAVVIHGRATELEGPDDRLHALRCISEHLLPGRWDEVREPSDHELKGTVVLAVEIEAASAKIRGHGVVHGKVAGDESNWAGVVPISQAVGAPETDPEVPIGVPVPASVERFCGGG